MLGLLAVALRLLGQAGCCAPTTIYHLNALHARACEMLSGMSCDGQYEYLGWSCREYRGSLRSTVPTQRVEHSIEHRIEHGPLGHVAIHVARGLGAAQLWGNISHCTSLRAPGLFLATALAGALLFTWQCYQFAESCKDSKGRSTRVWRILDQDKDILHSAFLQPGDITKLCMTVSCAGVWGASEHFVLRAGPSACEWTKRVAGGSLTCKSYLGAFVRELNLQACRGAVQVHVCVCL